MSFHIGILNQTPCYSSLNGAPPRPNQISMTYIFHTYHHPAIDHHDNREIRKWATTQFEISHQSPLIINQSWAPYISMHAPPSSSSLKSVLCGVEPISTHLKTISMIGPGSYLHASKPIEFCNIIMLFHNKRLGLLPVNGFQVYKATSMYKKPPKFIRGLVFCMYMITLFF